MSQLPIAILISGRSTNMRVIAERAAARNLPVDVRVVVSDKSSAEGLQTAAAMKPWPLSKPLEDRSTPSVPSHQHGR